MQVKILTILLFHVLSSIIWVSSWHIHQWEIDPLRLHLLQFSDAHSKLASQLLLIFVLKISPWLDFKNLCDGTMRNGCNHSLTTRLHDPEPQNFNTVLVVIPESPSSETIVCLIQICPGFIINDDSFLFSQQVSCR